MEIVGAIEDKFRLNIPDAALREVESVADVAAAAAPIGLERLVGAAGDQQVKAMFGWNPCNRPTGETAARAARSGPC